MSDIKIYTNSMEKDRRRILKISWSKYRQHNECPASWFCINYAEFVNVMYVKIDQTTAIPGIIIQKLFETFINKRIYTRCNMDSYEKIVEWFQMNSRALFKLIARPINDQTLSKYKDIWGYFKSVEGLLELEDIRNRYYLDPVIKPPNVTFVNSFELEKQYGGEEGFLNHLSGLYKPILDLFLEQQLDLNLMLSETYIETILDDVILNGYIDFIYNKNNVGDSFLNLNYLMNDFIVLDGKFKVKRYTVKEQLMFYATLLYLKHHKIPNNVGFIDWSKPGFKFYPYDTAYLELLRKSILLIKNKYFSLRKVLNECGSKIISLSDLDLCYTPSNACVFCPIIMACEPALKRKKDLINFLQGMENRRDTNEHLRNIGVDLKKSIQDIHM